MRHFQTRALLAVTLVLPLGACNSFLGIKLARHAPPAAPADPLAGTTSATALGRAQLAEGRTGLAVESFQKALAAGEPMAPAVNGLGVAYARLGRFDLAQRYFQQAMASDPADARYADNLARLMRSPTFALRRDGDPAQAALRAAAVPEVRAALIETARMEPVLGKLQRVSRGEVHIATAPAQAAPIAAPHGIRTAGKADGEFRPLVRFSIAEPADPSSPVRILLPEPKPADAATVAKAKAAMVAR